MLTNYSDVSSQNSTFLHLLINDCEVGGFYDIGLDRDDDDEDCGLGLDIEVDS